MALLRGTVEQRMLHLSNRAVAALATAGDRIQNIRLAMR